MAITDNNGDTISPLGGWRILSNSTARKTINLDPAPAAGRKVVIVDAVGDAASNNITINANGSEKIDGASSLTISTNSQRKVLESNGSGWTVISTTADSNAGSVSTGGGGYATSFSDLASLSNDAGSGEVVKFGSGTLTAGKLYYLESDSNWKEADANYAVSGSGNLLGIAVGSSPTSNGLLVSGFFDAHSYLPNYSAGAAVYVSNTPGQMTTTQPTGSTYKRVVGYCSNASKVIYFKPESSRFKSTVPIPSLYFDGTSEGSLIGSNSFSNATITTDNGKYDAGFIDFGASGNTAPARFTNEITLTTGIYTFSMWFYSKRTGSDWGTLLRQASGGSPANTQNLPIVTRDTDDMLGMFNEDGGGTFYSSGYDMTTHEGSTSWIHIAVVANGSNSRFFVNGAYVGTAAAVVNTSVKELGAYDGNDTQVFSEGIDDFSYWNTALSDEQVEEIYNSGDKISHLVFK